MSISQKIFLAFAFAFAVILSGAVTSLYGTARLVGTGSAVKRSDEVLARISDTLALVVDADTGVRGFALAGRDEFLEPYERARARLPDALAELRRLTADAPTQQARLDELDDLVAERIALADDLIEVRRSRGLEAAARQVAAGRGREVMNRIRRVFDVMEDEEHRLLVERARADREATRWIFAIAGGVPLAALLLVVIGALLARRAIIRPIEELLRGVERMGAGDLGVQVDERGRDEFGRLARSFNHMVRTRGESEERFRLALDEAPIGMALVGHDGRFLRVNRALCEFLGYTPAELMGATFQAITHPDDVAADVALAARVWRGEVPRYQLAKRYIRKDGSVVDGMLSASVLRDPGGRPLYYVRQVEDVTERRRAEEALRRSEEALRRAQRVAHLGSWERELPDGPVRRSEELYAIFGVEPRQPWTGPEALLPLVHPADRERVLAARAALEREGGSLALEHRIVRPDGTERVVRVLAECVRERGGRSRFFGTMVDITDLARARREREASLRWLRQMLEESPVGLVLFRRVESGERSSPSRTSRR
jgi:PAS domain S-box-containing protein